MTESTIRQAIVDGINTVNDVGMVYDHIPFSASWDVHLALFKCQINGRNAWRGFTVSLANDNPISQSGFVMETTSGADTVDYRYVIRGYHAISEADDSENEFIETVIAVMAKLDTLNLSTYRRDLAQLTVYQPETIGDVLCHYAEIALNNIREDASC